MPVNHLRLFAYFTAYAAVCLWAAVLYRHFTAEVKQEQMIIEAQQAIASETKPELYQEQDEEYVENEEGRKEEEKEEEEKEGMDEEEEEEGGNEEDEENEGKEENEEEEKETDGMSDLTNNDACIVICKRYKCSRYQWDWLNSACWLTVKGKDIQFPLNN